jgi:hypothetical protein
MEFLMNGWLSASYPTLRTTTPRTRTCPRGPQSREGWGTRVFKQYGIQPIF